MNSVILVALAFFLFGYIVFAICHFVVGKMADGNINDNACMVFSRLEEDNNITLEEEEEEEKERTSKSNDVTIVIGLDELECK